MARLGEIAHTPSSGSVDATPFWLLVVAETVAWTGDDALWRDLLPHARRALAWLEQRGEVDGDGLVEDWARGRRQADRPPGVEGPHDPLHHADGRAAGGEIALVEVQGYVFAASARSAAVAAGRGEGKGAARRAEAANASLSVPLPDRRRGSGTLGERRGDCRSLPADSGQWAAVRGQRADGRGRGIGAASQPPGLGRPAGR
jgi:hypothetical protein